MDSSEEDPGKLVGPLDCSLPSLFDLSRILVGGILLVPFSLLGPPVVSDSCKCFLFSVAWQGWVVSGSFNSLSFGSLE